MNIDLYTKPNMLTYAYTIWGKKVVDNNPELYTLAAGLIQKDRQPSPIVNLELTIHKFLAEVTGK